MARPFFGTPIWEGGFTIIQKQLCSQKIPLWYWECLKLIDSKYRDEGLKIVIQWLQIQAVYKYKPKYKPNTSDQYHYHIDRRSNTKITNTDNRSFEVLIQRLQISNLQSLALAPGSAETHIEVIPGGAQSIRSKCFGLLPQELSFDLPENLGRQTPKYCKCRV